MQLTVEEQQLCQRINLDADVALTLKEATQQPIQQARETIADLGQTQLAPGLSSAVEGDFLDCMLVVETVREALPEGWLTFYSTRDANSEQLEVVVLPNPERDSLLAVRFRATSSASYGLSTNSIVAQLQAWQKQFAFTVVGAAPDYVALEFQTLPANVCQFAEEVYRFCPDAVEQGVGLMEEEEDPEFFAQAHALCPTISGETRAFIATELRQVDEGETEEELAQAQEETEMGIRLLANHIKAYQSLFLWWD